MSVTMTERAATQVLTYLSERGGGLGIRALVESSECSGLAYRLVFVDEEDADDQVFESHGARLFIDPKSLAWLDGTVVDFVETGDDSGFAFNNPNAKEQCTCGNSFHA
jgi:iron-sulfur cluster assembly protein